MVPACLLKERSSVDACSQPRNEAMHLGIGNPLNPVVVTAHVWVDMLWYPQKFPTNYPVT